MFMLIILACLILLAYVRISNNNDIINNNVKNDSDIANVNNAKKAFRKSKTTNYMLIGAIILFIVILICQFTDLDYKLLDLISSDFVTEPTVDISLYLFPIYIIVIREIFIQVKISEFLLKYFKVEEIEINVNEEILKPLLTKTNIIKTKNNEKK